MDDGIRPGPADHLPDPPPVERIEDDARRTCLLQRGHPVLPSCGPDDVVPVPDEDPDGSRAEDPCRPGDEDPHDPDRRAPTRPGAVLGPVPISGPAGAPARTRPRPVRRRARAVRTRRVAPPVRVRRRPGVPPEGVARLGGAPAGAVGPAGPAGYAGGAGGTGGAEGCVAGGNRVGTRAGVSRWCRIGRRRRVAGLLRVSRGRAVGIGRRRERLLGPMPGGPGSAPARSRGRAVRPRWRRGAPRAGRAPRRPPPISAGSPGRGSTGHPAGPSTASSASPSCLGRRSTQMSPITATASETTKTASEARPRRSASDWHCWTKVSHWWCSVVLAVVGSGPAPMEPGWARAWRAVSEPVLGPQVPPIGRGRQRGQHAGGRIGDAEAADEDEEQDEEDACGGQLHQGSFRMPPRS